MINPVAMQFFLLVVVLFIVIFVIKFYYDDKEVLKRELKRLSFSSGYSTCKDDDVVRLKGVVEMHESIILAPLSMRECVYYQVVIEQNVGKNWEAILSSEKSVNFFISNGNEKALISTRNTWHYLRHEVTYHSGMMGEFREVLKAYLVKRKHVSPNSNPFVDTQYRCHERILELEDNVSVAGRVAWKPSSQLGLPESEGKILYLKTIDDKNPLLLSNDPDLVLMKDTMMDALKNRLWKQ